MRVRVLLLAALLPVQAPAAIWQIENETSVQVDAGWHGQMVTVRFPSLAGRIDFDEKDMGAAHATVSVATADATTGVAVVDQIVRSADFLDARDFPQITFHLDQLRQTGPSTADVKGRITLRGITRPTEMKATVIRYGPDSADPRHFEAGFDIRGSIDRTEFGSRGGLPDVGPELGLRIRLYLGRQ